jgi:ketosteroid isomerase-like protein
MIFSIAILALAMQATAAPAVAPEEAADQLDARFVSDLHDKKVDDVLSLYSQDAVFLQPDGTAVPAAGLRKLYEQVTSSMDSDLHLTRVALKRSVNTVIEDGAYAEELDHHDTGKVEHVNGTYRFIFHKGADGKWLFSRMEWH